APSLPTKDAFQIFSERFKGLIKTKDEEPQIYQDNLQIAVLNVLDKVAAPPACGPLLNELKVDIEQWIQTNSQNERFKVLAFPPGFSNELIYTWTKQEQYHIISPPKRSMLFTTKQLETGLKKI